MGTQASVSTRGWSGFASTSAPCDTPWLWTNSIGSPWSTYEGCFSDTRDILFSRARPLGPFQVQLTRHCERLALMSVALGIGADLGTADLVALYCGGYLHDVGKAGIPESIMLKPGELTPEEWAIVRSHPARGEDICRARPSLAPVLPLIRHHHERWDGSGYPDGLRGEQIPLGARLLQIVDIYDALISRRTYKPAYPPEVALEIIRDETMRGWRDPAVVELFMAMHGNVISRIANYTAEANRTIDSMRSSLRNLELFLEAAQTS